MVAMTEQEDRAVDASPSVWTQYRETAAFAEDLRPEQRTDLTIKEAEELAQGEPFELIDGRIVFKMADSKHSRIQITLGAKLYNYFEQNPIGEVMPEFSLRLGRRANIVCHAGYRGFSQRKSARHWKVCDPRAGFDH